ncbi:MAG: ribonuclease T2 [Pseudomonadota bacterium]
MRALRGLWLAFTLLGATLARADGESAGHFDYYVLALSWQSTWCALEGDERQDPECANGTNRGWVLHGLWPQFQQGWPAYCPTLHNAPSRRMTAQMADIMGSSGLAWHQWNKHGRCSGLSALDYFALSRRAYDAVSKPEVFRKLKDPVRLPARVVEEAFLKANPDWSPDMIAVKCSRDRIHEVRLCLSKELDPMRCGRDVARDCTLPDALMSPIR